MRRLAVISVLLVVLMVGSVGEAYMAQTAAFDFGVPGAEIWIEYHQANLRIQAANWIIPEGVIITVKVWDTDVDPVDPVVIRQVTGPDEGYESIPGNYQLVEREEFGEIDITLPDNILVEFNAEYSTP